MKIVILAGGIGTRFWPMSRRNSPKQLCQLISKKTMLEETLERFKEYPRDKVYISVTRDLLEETKKALPKFPKKNYIIEPAPRDTAPAMGYVAAVLELKDPDEPMVFIPSDHHIGRVERFLELLQEAEKVILETGKMLDISVYPTSPSTTLGYTKVGKLKKETNGVEFYEFLGHKEKPELKTAQEYVQSGKYLWHANYYMWTPRKFMEAYKKYAPETHALLVKIQGLIKSGKSKEISRIYDGMEKTSIDYAITEKMDPKEVLIIRGDFEWDDLGAWDTLYQNMLIKTDEKKNIVKGDRLNIDTSGCLIFGRDKKIIVTLGVDDLVIVDTEDALLICPKSRAQEVKKVVDELKLRGGKYL